jgi:hypothetical protein
MTRTPLLLVPGLLCSPRLFAPPFVRLGRSLIVNRAHLRGAIAAGKPRG